jgi:ATP-dependent protease ClpP protease subunit
MKKPVSKNAGAGAIMLGGSSCKDMFFEVPHEPDLVYYLYGPLEDEADYIELIHELRYASPEKHITIHINSPGGSLYACMAIINAIDACQGEVLTVLDGEASSAAAMIWLAGHVKAIASKMVVLMVHTASTGFMPTKLPEIKVSIEVTDKLIRMLIDELCEGVLTKEEFTDVYRGHDVYLTGDEIIKRMPEMVEPENEPEE